MQGRACLSVAQVQRPACGRQCSRARPAQAQLRGARCLRLRYATTCINHARRLYALAKLNEGCYVTSVPDAANFYKTTHWMDHMAYAAAWLYAATGEQAFLTDAQTYYARHVNDEGGGKVRPGRRPPLGARMRRMRQQPAAGASSGAGSEAAPACPTLPPPGSPARH
jgi:hypothetical protein